MYKVVGLIVLLLSSNLLAEEKDYQLNIHVHYQQQSDSWKVIYDLPIAVDHIAFSRRSQFDRRQHFKLDTDKFRWDRAGKVLLIRSIDNTRFDSVELTFDSRYEFIQKDYKLNIRYSDGSLLLFSDHLSLGANTIKDHNISPIGLSFKGTKFHFYAPDQNIMLMGKSYKNAATSTLASGRTYIYFGGIKPITTDNILAVVDPKLPSWMKKNMEDSLPKLFDYYRKKTKQPLSFKPIVFFNYDSVEGSFSGSDGGVHQGLMLLTASGKRWQLEDKPRFNKIFHLLAHESAHFWNGQMFDGEKEQHSWMSEGGADVFAHFAMAELGLTTLEEMLQKFESAANDCILNKGDEALEDSLRMRKTQNYYSCGAIMALASHVAIRRNNKQKSLFDLWSNIFKRNLDDRDYNQQDYLEELSKLAGSNTLSKSLHRFSSTPELDNTSVIRAWLNDSFNISMSNDYPQHHVRHWGKRAVMELMQTHCNTLSMSHYDSYIQTYPIKNCEPFAKSMEIKYIDGKDILSDGVAVYKAFHAKCKNKGTVALQDTSKKTIRTIQCLKPVAEIRPYLKLKPKKSLSALFAG